MTWNICTKQTTVKNYTLSNINKKPTHEISQQTNSWNIKTNQPTLQT